MRFPPLKKLAGLISLVIVCSLFSLSDLRAQATGSTAAAPSSGTSTSADSSGASTQYLQKIEENTRGVLDRLNNIPTYLGDLGVLIRAWVTADDSDTTANLQANFTELSTLLNNQAAGQDTLLVKTNTDLLNNDVGSVYNANNDANNAIIINNKNLPYANDLVYSTLIGKPYFSSDPRKRSGGSSTIDPPYNYIRNASGINLYHPFPATNWQGSTDDLSRYQNYYNIVMAAESFGAYVLSRQYADAGQMNTLQTKLITQASDPSKWFAQVASENIGFVLRQILLYESQMFIMLTQLVQTQREAVTAQIMTNTILIGNNQLSEGLMISNAKLGTPQ